MIDRKHWERRSFWSHNPVVYKCPECFQGSLRLMKPQGQITAIGIWEQKNSAPNGIEKIFSTFLKCELKDCGFVATMSGVARTKSRYIDEETHSVRFGTVYYPKYCHPNLRLFELGVEVPKEIRQEIDVSFTHYFNDLSSCANRIRTSIELILNDIKAQKKFRDKKGNLKKIPNLHQRIIKFEKRNKRLSKLMLAVKFIGNEGSHIGNVEIEDVIDAYIILEQLIELIYIKNHKRIEEIANEIVQKGKPRTKTRQNRR